MTILDRILLTKRNEVDLARRRVSPAELRIAALGQPPARDFWAAVASRQSDSPALIAEIKKSSPSAGLIVPDFDAVAIATIYTQAGAGAISVLTDRTFFGGDLGLVARVKEASPLPVLRKDFILDEYQVVESRAAGADAVLLIAEALAISGLAQLLPIVRAWGMLPMVEVHGADVLIDVLDSFGAPSRDNYLLGINNRNLMNQRTDRGTMVRLGALLPPGTLFVAESGLSSRSDVLAAGRAGASAVLMGEAILKSDDPRRKIEELLGSSQQ